MSFVNVLNETARDADVYRILARGKGFKATEKVQKAFRLGVVLAFAAILVRLYVTLGVDVLILAFVASSIAGKMFFEASTLLYSTGSIVKYWRPEKGGKPDADDPYDLSIPVERCLQRADLGRRLSAEYNVASGASKEAPSAATSYPSGQDSRAHVNGGAFAPVTPVVPFAEEPESPL